MWRVWSLFIGLSIGIFVWFSGGLWNGGFTDLVALAAFLVLFPIFWEVIRFLVVVLIFLGFL